MKQGRILADAYVKANRHNGSPNSVMPGRSTCVASRARRVLHEAGLRKGRQWCMQAAAPGYANTNSRFGNFH